MVNAHLFFSDHKNEHTRHREEKERRHKERRHHVRLSSSSTRCVLMFISCHQPALFSSLQYHSDSFLQDEKREHKRDSGDHRGVKDLKGEEDVRHRRGGGRERAERDEHRERAARADVEPERNHRRDAIKKSASEKSHRHEAQAEVRGHFDGLCAVREACIYPTLGKFS